MNRDGSCIENLSIPDKNERYAPSQLALLAELNGKFAAMPASGFSRMEYLRAWRHVELVAMIRIQQGYGISVTQIIDDLTDASELFIHCALAFLLNKTNATDLSFSSSYSYSNAPPLSGYPKEVIDLDRMIRNTPNVPDPLRRLMLLLRLSVSQKEHLIEIVNAAVGGAVSEEDEYDLFTIAQSHV